MAVVIHSHRHQVEQRLEQAFEKTAKAFEANLHLVLRLKRGWAKGFGTTHRQNGQIVTGSFRNIFDTGELDSSQRMVFLSPFRVRYTWSAPHSQIVHEGCVLRNGTRIPARRFTRVAAREANLPKRFADMYKGAT